MSGVLLFEFFDTLHFGVEFARFVFEFAFLALEPRLDLFCALFRLCDLLVAFVYDAVVFTFKLDEFLFGLEDFLLFDHFALRFGLFEDLGAAFF